MKQDVLVWRAKETGVFSREEAKKNTEKNIQLEGIYYKIGDGAFKNNIRIHSVILDENVKEIGQESFYNCTSLRQIKMGQIRIIHKYAFYNCTRLTEIELPKETEFIGARAFSLCKRLQGIQFSGKNQCKKIQNEVFADCESLEEMILPEGIISIGNKAFYRCTSMKKITLPETLKTIGTEAFLKCKELEYVRIPPNVKSIGARAFYGCNKLKVLEMEAVPEHIGEMFVNKNVEIRCGKDTSY